MDSVALYSGQEIYFQQSRLDSHEMKAALDLICRFTSGIISLFQAGSVGTKDNAGTSFTGNFLWPSPTITPVRVYEFSFFYLSSPDEVIRGDQWLWIFFWPTVHCSYQLDIPGIQFAKPANIGFIRLEFRGWGNMMGI